MYFVIIWFAKMIHWPVADCPLLAVNDQLTDLWPTQVTDVSITPVSHGEFAAPNVSWGMPNDGICFSQYNMIYDNKHQITL